MAANPKSSSGEQPRPIIIIKRYKKGGGGHHGGAWKVAYADFVTAMMAFFLVMWLVTAVSKDQRAAIFDYFKNPSMEPGKSVKPAPGQMGPGGASTSPINLRGGLDAPRSSQMKTDRIGATVMTSPAPPITLKTEEQKAAEADELKRLLEKKQLEALLQNLKEAINKSQALEPYKDQLFLDITPEGLRIQIVDAQNRPMFDRGSSRLKPYTAAILKEVAGYLNTVPNHVSITGHTDITPYAGISGYTNWDLSTDRANAARRSLEASGFDTSHVARVTGLASSVLFDKKNPGGPINRRISIVVMTQKAEEQATRIEIPSATNQTGPTALEPVATAKPGDVAEPAKPGEVGAAPGASVAEAPVPASLASAVKQPAAAPIKPTATAVSALVTTTPAANAKQPAANSATPAANAKPAAANSNTATNGAKPAAPQAAAPGARRSLTPEQLAKFAAGLPAAVPAPANKPANKPAGH